MIKEYLKLIIKEFDFDNFLNKFYFFYFDNFLNNIIYFKCGNYIWKPINK